MWVEKIKNLLFNKEALSNKEKQSLIELKQWEQEKIILERKQKIKEEKSFFKKKVSFSKFLMIFLFINFTILEIFTGWVTISTFNVAYAVGSMPDFTPLITLLGAVIGETLSFGIYSAKSKAENVKNGIVFESVMKEKEINENAVG